MKWLIWSELWINLVVLVELRWLEWRDDRLCHVIMPRCLLERCIILFYIWIYLFFLFTWMRIQVLIWVMGPLGLISDSSWWFLFGPFCSCKFILAQIINYLDMWKVIWDESLAIHRCKNLKIILFFFPFKILRFWRVCQFIITIKTTKTLSSTILQIQNECKLKVPSQIENREAIFLFYFQFSSPFPFFFPMKKKTCYFLKVLECFSNSKY
jgi:hypothetical protein